MRTGISDLPLHGGHAPKKLFRRMVSMSGEISRAIIYEHGEKEFLKRISNPYFFQSFSCVIGFDWHSSGTTTTACGALKIALSRIPEVEVKVCGGKGGTSRKTPSEIRKYAEVFGFSPEKENSLVKLSRLSAKKDNTSLQDGFSLYHHCFFVSKKSGWAVVQQGMGQKFARRYQWFGEKAKLSEIHDISCDIKKERTLDMISPESKEARKISLDLSKEKNSLLRFFKTGRSGQTTLSFFEMPKHHFINEMDLTKRDVEVLKTAYELQPGNYDELLLIQGMGPKKIRALALVSDLIYGEAPSWKDPVKYSFSHGGKDGTPYPVDYKNFDHSISFLRSAVNGAKLGKKEKLKCLAALNNFTVRDSGKTL